MGHDIPRDTDPTVSMRVLVSLAHQTARDKGFHEYTPEFGVAGQDTRHILSWLMLITTEVAEAAEAVRIGDRENFEEEISDILIRIFDLCGALNIDIETTTLNKMGKNKNREHKHGGKLA